jgi:hypothetical protein
MSEQFERNHEAIHQAAPGNCSPCDRGRADRGETQVMAGAAAAAVVDLRDGMTWVRGPGGDLFTAATAEAYARLRNSDCTPGWRTYRVATLTLTSYDPATDAGGTP